MTRDAHSVHAIVVPLLPAAQNVGTSAARQAGMALSPAVALLAQGIWAVMLREGEGHRQGGGFTGRDAGS